MNKAYSKTTWKNYPSVDSPINEQNLNNIENGVDEIDNRVITLDNTKATKLEVSELFSNVSFDEQTGIITFTRKNGATVTIDTKLEKLAVNFAYDASSEQLVITLDDGTKQYVDLSALITQYEFVDSDTIAFLVGVDGKVTAVVKEGSIEEKHLRPDYLADIKVESAKAEASADNAETSEANAKKSEDASKASETAAKASEDSAATSASTASSKASEAANSAAEALISQDAAKASEDNAKASETAAKESETNADASATIASNKADEASDSADLSKSYAVGGTGTRDGEDTDNSKYYCNQSHGFRDEAEEFSKSIVDTAEQINKKLELAEFYIDDDGNLIYTDVGAYTFLIDDDGMLNYSYSAIA